MELLICGCGSQVPCTDLKWNHMAFVEEGGSGPNLLLGKDLAGSGLIIEEEHLKI